MKNTVNWDVVGVGRADEFQLWLCVLRGRPCVCVTQSGSPLIYKPVRGLYQAHHHVASFSKINPSPIDLGGARIEMVTFTCPI